MNKANTGSSLCRIEAWILTGNRYLPFWGTQLHTMPGGIAVKEKPKVYLHITEVFFLHSKLFASSL